MRDYEKPEANDPEIGTPPSNTIPQDLDQLSESIDHLMENLGELSKKLEPILEPPSPQTDNVPSKKVEETPNRSYIGERIAEYRRMVRNANRRVNALIIRLEL